LSLFSLFQKDSYLNCLIRNTKGNVVPVKITQEFEREKRQNNSVDLLKFEMFQREISLYQLIKPYLLNKDLRFLVSHFFETELCIHYPFIIKESFLLQLTSLIPTDTLPEVITEPSSYLFLGQLLTIMRISAISLYNCGYPEIRHSFTVPPEVVNLAKLCLDEIRKPLHESTLEYIQLSVLLEFYNLYGPESVASIDDLISLDINRLIRITSISGYNSINLTPNDSSPAGRANNLKGFIWNKLIELDYIKFLNDGTPLSLNEEYYSTHLPSFHTIKSGFSETDIIFSSFRERRSVFPMIKPFSGLLNNMKDLPTIDTLELHLDRIIDYITVNSLEKILAKSSKTLEERILKSVQFVNLIDLACLNYMVSLHVLLTPNLEAEKRYEMAKRVMKSMNFMVNLSYFLDSSRHHLYNLQAQFGYSFHLIPRILQSQHRAFQFQLSLLVRSHYHGSATPNFTDGVLENLKNVSVTNIRVMLVNFRKNSKFNIYCKRLHMMHSFMVIKNFGVSVDKITSLNFLNLLESSVLQFEDKDLHQIHEVFQSSLITMKGDQEILNSNSYDGLERDIEDFFEENGLNSSTIDQLEKFLERQMFMI
jgi:hypothetical protein